MLDGNVLYLVLGIAIGVLLTAKSVKDMVGGMPEAVVPYTLFGLLLFGATGAIGWAGFACVIVAFVFYHAIGREGWSTALQSFFSFKWLRRKQQAVADTVASHNEQVDLAVFRAVEDSAEPMSKTAISNAAILNVLPDGMVDNEGNMVGASLVRLIAADKIEADGNGMYVLTQAFVALR